MSGVKLPQVGDIWYRVDGEWIDDGSEQYVGMELGWTSWRVTRITPRGAWFQCVERHWRKPRFALASGARWISPTKEEALERLVARKRRHLEIISQQEVEATETLSLAKAALSAFGSVTKVEQQEEPECQS